MKKTIWRFLCQSSFAILLLLAFLFHLKTYAQSETEQKINAVRKNFTDINAQTTKYKVDSVEIMESTESGIVKWYSDSTNNLKKVIVIYYGEMGKTVYEYYLMNKQLSFVFEQNYTYNRPIYYDAEMAEENGDTEVWDIKKSIIAENRYYFDSKKLIRWLDENKKQVLPTLKTFLEKEAEVPIEFERIVKDFCKK